MRALRVLVPILMLAWAVPAPASSRALFEAGDFAPAEAAAQVEVAANPGHLEALLVLGQAQLMLDRPGDAVRALRQAVRRHPDSAEAHYRLGQALTLHVARSGLWRRMLLGDDIGAAFARAVELAPRNPEYRWALFEFCRQAPALVGGGRRKAEAHAATLAELDPARGRRARAALLLQDGDAAQAERELRAAVAARPDEPDHRYALGYFFQQRERWDEAFATFEDIARRFPAEVETAFQIGRTAAMSGRRLDEGVAALERYLRYKPRAGEPPLAWAHYRLGMIHELRRDRAAAAAAYEAALELNPRLTDARAALAALRDRA
jgi:tetratricopeptide (TPR) repeat protein